MNSIAQPISNRDRKRSKHGGREVTDESDERESAGRGESRMRANSSELSTAVEWRDDFGSFATSLKNRVLEETRKNPKLLLGAAIGVGFILGGGLATRLGRLALLSGIQLALRAGLPAAAMAKFMPKIMTP